MNTTFIYFDGPEERETVIRQIQEIRAEVQQIAEQVPEQHHFLPRYGGRSLAVTLVHLQFFDMAALWFVQASANLRDDAKLHPPRALVRSADRIVLQFFKRRRVATTLKDIQKKEGEICDYIREVPLELLHKDVCHPGRREPYTVEKALQVYFVHYWQRHLALMRQVEGVAGKG
jgi:hypothetical protein